MLSTVIAEATRSDIWLLWIILAFIAAGAAIYLAFHNAIVPAVVCLVIAVVLLVIAL